MSADDSSAGRSLGKMDALLGELERLAREAPKEVADRLASLTNREQAEAVLRVPARERLELLLHAPKPMRLVRSLPDAEVYLTVREVGPHDSLPLLSLASAQQIVHLMDLEAWRGEVFDANRAGGWVALLLEAGEPTLLRFLRNADDEFLALLLARWMRVRGIEMDDTPSIHGVGETEAGTEEGFLAPDGWHRFSPTIKEHGPAVRRLAEILFQDDPQRYERLVWAAEWELPAEVEEYALHWRQSRLEEHGFPTPEEALAVYAPPKRVRSQASAPETSDPEALASPRTALRTAGARGLLVQAIDSLHLASRERALMEITAVANRILVADRADTGDLVAHRAAFERAAAFVEIALNARGARAPDAAARTVEQVPVLELFREGYARAAAVQSRARALVATGWPRLHPRSLETLDGPLRSQIGALLEARPRFFDAGAVDGRSGLREFRSLEEIEQARVQVELAEVLGRLVVETLGWNLPARLDRISGNEGVPRLSAFVLSSLAWHATTGRLRGEGLPSELAARFLQEASDEERASRALETFLVEASAAAGLDERAVSELRAFGRACLERLAEERRGRTEDEDHPRRGSALLLAD